MSEERRLVTVLFADVCGSTALGEARDPEDVRALLAAFFAIARDVVETHGGTLEKFIGDAAMAVFGLPVAHDDDAARALSAALEMRDRTRAHATLGTELPIRLGVHSGEVVATTDLSGGDFLVTGDTVNTAARLEQAAAPWEILASERTVRAVGDRFAWGRPRRIAARGKASPVRARALGPARGVPDRRRVPLVDREADLAQLALVADRAFAEHRPYLVTIVAPPGTGKTRLVEEFVARLAADREPRPRVLSANCLPYGQRLTFWPLRGLLLGLLGIGDDEATATTIRTETERWLGVAGDAAAAPHAELIATSIGFGETEPGERSLVFGAWRALVERAAADRPLVIVAEDLHWSSDTLLDLVEHMLAPLGELPLLGIVIARPELLDRRPDWGGGRRNYLAVALAPLPDLAVGELVDLRLGQHVPEVVRRVTERADGNPFFVGELVRTVADQARLDDDASIAEALRRLPDTVQAAVQSQLDLVSPDERRLLQLGSIQGRVFRLDGVAAVTAGLPIGPESLRHLEERDLVGSLPTGELAFRHALIREVAYQTLTRGDRAAAHAATARWLASGAAGAPDQLAELVATHAREAVALQSVMPEGPDEELRVFAIAWLRRAAERTAWAGAIPEALGHVQRALELARPAEISPLHELRGDILIGGQAALDEYVLAIGSANAPECTDGDRLRLIGKRLAVLMRWCGSIASRPSSREMADEIAAGEELMARADDPRAAATFLIARGFVPYWYSWSDGPMPAGEMARSREAAERGLALAREIGDPVLQSEALDALAGIAQSTGRHRQAREHARERLAFEHRLDLSERLDAHAFCAWESCLLGDYAEAVRVTDEAEALIAAQGASVPALHLTAWRVHALAMLGRWDEALTLTLAAEAIWQASGRPAAAYAIQAFVAGIGIARARADEAGLDRWRQVVMAIASQFTERAMPSARHALHLATDDRTALLEIVERRVALTERPHLVERALARCLDLGWLPTEASLRRLASVAGEEELAPLEAQARRGLGLHGAAAELSRARQLAEQMGDRALAGRTAFELGLATGDESLAETGRETLERLGDVGYLESHLVQGSRRRTRP